ncbi:MAG TPA: hydroxyacid dehydrogenase [Rhodopila sp.]|nr:hydroxyacid dehydrogenase [Rhodopila sp.]
MSPQRLVVLTDTSIHADAVDRLRACATLRILDGYPDETALIEACRDADAILARLGVVTGRVIEAAPRLRIIARHGAGSDGVDLPAATARGIVVTTAGPANAGAVAEYTIALLLGFLRKVPLADRSMRDGLWTREPLVGEALEGRTLGIVGCGAVGARVARIAVAFGMNVLASQPRLLRQDPLPVPTAPLHEVLARSDIVSLHLRLTPETAGLVDAAAIGAMKPGAVLVNTARGELVDEPALIAALWSGRLAGAALDTYAVEPLPPGSPLRRMSNVLISPHVAGQTHQAVLRVGHTAVQAILDEFAGKRPAFVVNPEAYAERQRINQLPTR